MKTNHCIWNRMDGVLRGAVGLFTLAANLGSTPERDRATQPWWRPLTSAIKLLLSRPRASSSVLRRLGGRRHSAGKTVIR